MVFVSWSSNIYQKTIVKNQVEIMSGWFWFSLNAEILGDGNLFSIQFVVAYIHINSLFHERLNVWHIPQCLYLAALSFLKVLSWHQLAIPGYYIVNCLCLFCTYMAEWAAVKFQYITLAVPVWKVLFLRTNYEYYSFWVENSLPATECLINIRITGCE